ncbi:AMP-binding enzyme [Actinomyces trachealis]|uniref:AMP-binding enzyme n=1 Tax=Actinomyces trachealis TaxID=2763540 RepID=UPI002E288725|nr:AMP-binding protein [Actinomyces trachealis]
MTKPAPRPLVLVTGGTNPDDVAHLRALLAERLTARGLLGSTGGGAGAATQGLPLLVPVAPGEASDSVREELAARLAESSTFPRADLLLRTSGSTTGSGSLVAVSARALVASARATHRRLSGPGVWVLALPAHHVAGLQVLVRSVLAGGEPVVVDASGGFSTAALYAGLEQGLAQAGGGPVYTSLVPTQVYDALADAKCAAVLSRLSAVLVGGADISTSLLGQAQAVGVPVVRTYGMSETGGGCVYDGLPLEGVRLRIDTPEADGVGRVVLAGPVLAEGYAAASGSTVFKTGADGLPEVLTSDLGCLRSNADGTQRLVVLGRVDDLIVTGGVKVRPQEVEAVLLSLPGVARACVVGVPHERWGSAVTAVVVPKPGVAADQAWCDGLRQAARKSLPGPQAPKQVLAADQLPMRGPGKIDRRGVAEWVLVSSQ